MQTRPPVRLIFALLLLSGVITASNAYTQFIVPIPSSAAQQGQAWTAPIGIPDPGFGITDTWPTLPSPWTSSTANFYYVKQGGTQGANGWPANPRGSIPNPIPAGAVVVIDSSVTFEAGANATFNFAGTNEGTRAWAISSGQAGLGGTNPTHGNGQATVRYTSEGRVWGDYGTLDGIDLFADSTGQATLVLGDWDDSPAADHIVFRHGRIRGNPTEKGGNAGNAVNLATFIVWYDMDIHDQGDWTADSVADVDCHGLATFGGTDYWILDSRIYHNQGDGIQVNGGAPNHTAADDGAQRVYIGRNVIYENTQTGVWFKIGLDLIVSQNEIYGHTVSLDAPWGTGGQYGFDYGWWLFNYVHDNGDTGIGFASTDRPFHKTIFLIGNVIEGNPVGISVWGGDAATDKDVYIVHNTLWNYELGIGFGSNTTGGNPRIENNLFANRTDVNLFEVDRDNNAGAAAKIKYNLFPASPRFEISGSTTTSVASMQSGDSTNRNNNASATPSFVNTSNLPTGLALQAGSAGVDGGSLVTDVYDLFQTRYGRSIRVDYNGTARPVNGTYDQGAFER